MTVIRRNGCGPDIDAETIRELSGKAATPGARPVTGQDWKGTRTRPSRQPDPSHKLRSITMGQTLHLGMPTAIESAAERTPYAAVFEDDGKVAYFYGLDTRLGNQPVLDAVQVYHVSSIL